MKIPVGKATSYQKVANHIGRPDRGPRRRRLRVGKNLDQACRARATASRWNQCALTGYHWGGAAQAGDSGAGKAEWWGRNLAGADGRPSRSPP